jgi:beta-glucosidase
VNAGNVSVTYIDETVKSILRTKFSLGLFESGSYSITLLKNIIEIMTLDPYPYADYLSTLRTAETRSLLHQMEQEAIVLLENRNNILPLSKSINSVALIGPQAGRVSVSSYIDLETAFFEDVSSLATTSSSMQRLTPSAP